MGNHGRMRRYAAPGGQQPIGSIDLLDIIRHRIASDQDQGCVRLQRTPFTDFFQGKHDPAAYGTTTHANTMPQHSVFIDRIQVVEGPGFLPLAYTHIPRLQQV